MRLAGITPPEAIAATVVQRIAANQAEAIGPKRLGMPGAVGAAARAALARLLVLRVMRVVGLASGAFWHPNQAPLLTPPQGSGSLQTRAVKPSSLSFMQSSGSLLMRRVCRDIKRLVDAGVLGPVLCL